MIVKNEHTWMKKQIGQIALITSGFAFASSCFNDEYKGVPLVRIRDVINGYSSTYYNGEYDNRYLVNQGDLLIGMDGEFNISAWKSDTALLNQRVCKIDFDISQVNPDYMFYLVRTELKKIEDRTPFVTVKHLSVRTLESVEVLLPPLAIQEQLAKCLKRAEQAIEKRKEADALMDQYLHSVFLGMFGDPVTNPKGWDIGALGNYIREIKYGTSTPPQFTDAGICFIRATNIKRGTIVSENMKYITPVEAETIEKCRLDTGDIIVVRSGVNTGDSTYVSEEYCGSYAGYDIVVKLENKLLNPIFVSTMLQSHYLDIVIKPLTRRAAQPHLNAEQIKNLPIILPPIEIQNKFADIVNTITQIKRKQECSLEQLKFLNKSLTQECFG